ncbi:hypothetical protein EJ08DRAFT_656211 [Tothia fuscella]|uniref:Uncharacterized protein n=1 Tax=Tothia fuscella TaxID=1048955 RepID=A0A9P4P397_9PEZI|nr:hypothetical protein EJ08DRAFT_656211 [Tothia fuscella]
MENHDGFGGRSPGNLERLALELPSEDDHSSTWSIGSNQAEDEDEDEALIAGPEVKKKRTAYGGLSQRHRHAFNVSGSSFTAQRSARSSMGSTRNEEGKASLDEVDVGNSSSARKAIFPKIGLRSSSLGALKTSSMRDSRNGRKLSFRNPQVPNTITEKDTRSASASSSLGVANFINTREESLRPVNDENLVLTPEENVRNEEKVEENMNKVCRRGSITGDESSELAPDDSISQLGKKELLTDVQASTFEPGEQGNTGAHVDDTSITRNGPSENRAASITPNLPLFSTNPYFRDLYRNNQSSRTVPTQNQDDKSYSQATITSSALFGSPRQVQDWDNITTQDRTVSETSSTSSSSSSFHSAPEFGEDWPLRDQSSPSRLEFGKGSPSINDTGPAHLVTGILGFFARRLWMKDAQQRNHETEEYTHAVKESGKTLPFGLDETAIVTSSSDGAQSSRRLQGLFVRLFEQPPPQDLVQALWLELPMIDRIDALAFHIEKTLAEAMDQVAEDGREDHTNEASRNHAHMRWQRIADIKVNVGVLLEQMRGLAPDESLVTKSEGKERRQ